MKPRKRVPNTTAPMTEDEANIPVVQEANISVGEEETGIPVGEEEASIPVVEEEANIPIAEEEASIQVDLDSELHQIPIAMHYEEGISVEEPIPIETLTPDERTLVQEHDIMTQDDLDFINMFDFSTPFEEHPIPFEEQVVANVEEQAVIVKEHPIAAGAIQKNKHGVRICHGPPSPTKKLKVPTQGSIGITTRPNKGKKPIVKKKYIAKKYCTRSSMNFNSVFFGNKDDPMNIE